MFIVPIHSSIQSVNIQPILNDSTDPKSEGSSPSNFRQTLQDVIQNVEDTEAVTKMDAYQLSIGKMDDLHTMTINSAKAEVALQTMVQLRNKLLDAYSEIMRTNL